jgi:tyrosine decarboxylase/aspartate 1-decarboxylase
MGMVPIPAGGNLFRDSSLTKPIQFAIPYLPGGGIGQATLVGTRPAASVAAVWALLKHLGRAGYREIVRRCMTLTGRLAEEVRKIEGLDLVLPPTLNMLGIKSTISKIQFVHDELKEMEWAPSLLHDHITAVVMPHITSQHVRDFVEDLRMTTSGGASSMLRKRIGI